MKFYYYISLVALLICMGCSKAELNHEKPLEEPLPSYANVDVDKVFTPMDSYLKNRKAVVSDIENFYHKIWLGGNLSGGFLVAKGGDILFENYTGYARENDSLPITRTTPMHVASVSKPLTAMAILKLVEAKDLALGDHLSKIFPGFPYPEITIAMLLEHRSGLPRYGYFLERGGVPTNQYITNRFILDYLIKNKPKLARHPGTGFMYSNTNYALLALVVEKLTNMPFPKAMQEMIFKPLKMKHTFIFQEKDIPTAAQSFYRSGRRLYPLNYLDLVYGDKNVYTTPRDLYNFSKALYDKNFLKPGLKRLIFLPYSNENPGIKNYGLGFRMRVYPNGEKLIYHTGWWHGSNALFVHLLKSKATIVAIGNVYSTRLYTTLALSGLFEDFPPQRRQLKKILGGDVADEFLQVESD